MKSRFEKILLDENHSYSVFVFANEIQRKECEEWEELDPQLKKTTSDLLPEHCKMMSLEHSISLLCNLFLDLQERVEALEKHDPNKN